MVRVAENRAARQRRCQEVSDFRRKCNIDSIKKYKGNIKKSHETQYYTEHKVSRRVIDKHVTRRMWKCKSKGAVTLYLNHGEVMTKTKSSRIEKVVELENQISKFSSTMVKVLLRQNTVKLGHSGAFQTVKFQNFLQPW